MLGIEHLKQGLKFVFDFTSQVAQTKKFKLVTIFSFIDDLIALGGVIVSWKDIIAEFKDLDDAEKQQLYQYVKDEFDIPNDKVEAFVENAFTWLMSTIELVEQAKGLKK